MNYWSALALFGSLAACTADKGETETEGGSTGGTDSASSTMTTGTPTTAADTTAADTTVADTTVPTTTSGDVTGNPTEDPTTGGGTGGVDAECKAELQDCAEGLKCTAYANMKKDTWDANKCVSETGDGVAGDPCNVEGGPFTGIDNCAKGYLCLNTDPEGKDGFCVEFCQPDLMSCPNTSGGAGICNVANEGVLPICLATCDPLVQDCPGAQACYGDPAGPPFICFGPDPQDGGQDGSTCEFTNACLAGLQCNDSATLEGCPADSIGCCTPFCPLDGDVCTGAEECVAFFMEPFPGFENVGICVLPG